jgi:uncharacterized membrane protein YbaN (DUF454 family)
MVRIVWAGLGLTFLAIGLVGIAIPLLPTTPFVLLAGVCFARGSHRLHEWLIRHPVFGPPLCQWKKCGAVSRSAKRAAIIAAAAVPLLTLLLGFPLYVAGLQCAVLAFPAAFVCSRPLPEGDGS